MFVTDSLRRYKDRKNLAKTFIVSKKFFYFIYPCIRAIPYQGILNLQKQGKKTH